MHSIQQSQGGKRLLLLPMVALVSLILALAILAATQALPSFAGRATSHENVPAGVIDGEPPTLARIVGAQDMPF